MSDSRGANGTPPSERLARIRAIVDEHLRRQRAGEGDSEGELLARHADLMPELAEAIAAGGATTDRPNASRASASHLFETQIHDPSQRARQEGQPPTIAGDITRAVARGNHGPADGSGAGNGDASADAATQGRGLKVRCPACRNYVDTVVDSSWTDITCSVCGSHFSLVDDTATTRAAAAVNTIGHFDLIEQLGAGAFGTVWKARDRDLDRTVAVKVPRKGQLETHEAEQFLREARAAAQLSHPNIVNIHEVGRDGDTIYIVSDIVRGVTLSEWMTSQALSTRQSTEIAAKIADALDHAHNKGVVHRDLKPGNVMLDAEMEPHIMDFGLAKRDVGELTMTIEGRVLGTPAYMSPEQARGEGHHADRRSDIYSLGVVLFQMLTGELPFRGNTRMLILQILNEEPPSPRKINPLISRDLETIVLRCLEKDPARRYATAREVAEELQRSLRGEPILARPVGRVERTWRWARRYPAVASLLATVLVLLVAVAGVASTGYFRTQGALATAERERDRAEREKHDANEARADALQQKTEAEGLKRKADELRADAERERDAARRAQELEVKARRQAEEFLYAQKIRNLCKAWESTDLPDDITPLLDALKPQHPGDPDLRGWEWHYLYRQINQSFDRTLVHAADSPVKSLSWNADGTLLASAGDDGVIVVWNAKTFDVVQKLIGHKGPINRIVWNPKSNRLLSAGRDGTVKMWNPASAKPVFSLSTRELSSASASNVSDVTFSPDGSQFAAVYKLRDIRVYRAESGDVVNTIETAAGAAGLSPNQPGVRVSSSAMRRMAWSPNGAWLATGWSDGSVQLWDVATGKPSGDAQVTYGGEIRELAWHHDSQRLAYASNMVGIWNVVTRVKRTLYGHVRTPYSVAWHDGEDFLAAVGSDGFARMWDLRSGNNNDLDRDVASLRRLTQYSETVAWQPKGEFIAAGGRDGKVRIWKFAPPQAASRRDRERAAISTIAWNPNGSTLLTAHQNNLVKFWNAATGERSGAWRIPNPDLRHVVWSPDGARIAVLANAGEGAGVFLRDAKTGREMGELSGMHGMLRLWISGMVGGPISMPQGPAITAVWSPDSKWIATTHYTNTIGIWDTKEGRFVRTLRGYSAGLIDWNSTGDLVAGGGADNAVFVWNPHTGKVVTTLKGHPGSIRAVAFSPDGKRLATAGSDDTIRVWDPRTGKQELRLIGYNGVTSVRWEPKQGKRLASLSTDNSVRLWDTTTGLELLTLRAAEDNSWSSNSIDTLAWSPDGAHLASRSSDRAVRIWNTNQLIVTEDPAKTSNLVFEGNLLPSGAEWKYLDDGSDQGDEWRNAAYDDSKWKKGHARLGYGDSGVATAVNYGDDPRRKHVTTYFRTTFDVPDPSKVQSLVLGLVRDDGAAVYVNGHEVARDNLRPGARHSSAALRVVNESREADIHYFAVDPAKLVSGKNVIAAEVHQATRTSSDLIFDSMLIADGVETLVAMLNSDEPELEAKAAERLAELGPGAVRAVPALLAYLRKSRGLGVDVEVLRALAKIGGNPDEVVPVLLELVDGRNFDWRHVETLRTMATYPEATDKMLPYLLRNLSQNNEAGTAAERTLTVLARAKSGIMADVVRKAREQSEKYRAAVCRIVAQLPGDQSELAPLIAALGSGESEEWRKALAMAKIRVNNTIEKPVDLLPWIELSDSLRLRGWSLEKGILRTPSTSGTLVVVPLVPPTEYTITAEVEPVDASRGLALGFQAGGRRVQVMIDYNTATALENVDGRNIVDNVTRREGQLLTAGKTAKIVCTVHKDRITVTVNGQVAVDFDGSFDRLSPNPLWNSADPGLLYFGNHSGYLVRSLSLGPK